MLKFSISNKEDEFIYSCLFLLSDEFPKIKKRLHSFQTINWFSTVPKISTAFLTTGIKAGHQKINKILIFLCISWCRKVGRCRVSYKKSMNLLRRKFKRLDWYFTSHSAYHKKVELNEIVMITCDFQYDFIGLFLSSWTVIVNFSILFMSYFRLLLYLLFIFLFLIFNWAMCSHVCMQFHVLPYIENSQGDKSK